MDLYIPLGSYERVRYPKLVPLMAFQTMKNILYEVRLVKTSKQTTTTEKNPWVI